MKKSRSLIARAGAVAAVTAGLVLAAAAPSYGWSSTITYQQPWGCIGGSLTAQSWIPSTYESRSTSAWAGSCATYAAINGGSYPYLFAALRYTSGGNSAGRGTVTSSYITTTGWAHYSTYRGGYHSWGSVVLYS